MIKAYFECVFTSPIDWIILALGSFLIAAHIVGLILRFQAKKISFVQGLDRYRTFCLLLTELLPIGGLLGTVLSLMMTFQTFQVAEAGKAPDLSQMVKAFAPAMSTTISGLGMCGMNLVLNAFIWMVCPTREKGHDE